MITAAEYAAAVLPELRRANIPVVLEPGRAVVGHSGALIARVVDVKQYPDGRRFAVLDTGMSELMRPALYGSFHRILPVSPRQTPETPWDVVGPLRVRVGREFADADEATRARRPSAISSSPHGGRGAGAPLPTLCSYAALAPS